MTILTLLICLSASSNSRKIALNPAEMIGQHSASKVLMYFDHDKLVIEQPIGSPARATTVREQAAFQAFRQGTLPRRDKLRLGIEIGKGPSIYNGNSLVATATDLARLAKLSPYDLELSLVASQGPYVVCSSHVGDSRSSIDSRLLVNYKRKHTLLFNGWTSESGKVGIMIRQEGGVKYTLDSLTKSSADGHLRVVSEKNLASGQKPVYVFVKLPRVLDDFKLSLAHPVVAHIPTSSLTFSNDQTFFNSTPVRIGNHSIRFGSSMSAATFSADDSLCVFHDHLISVKNGMSLREVQGGAFIPI